MPMPAKEIPEKYCLACGKRLERHRYNGRLEDYSRFLSRTCSPENIQTLCIHCHVSHHHRAKAAGVSPAGRLIPVTTIPVGEETP